MDIAAALGIIGLWGLLALMGIGLKKLEKPTEGRP